MSDEAQPQIELRKNGVASLTASWKQKDDNIPVAKKRAPRETRFVWRWNSGWHELMTAAAHVAVISRVSRRALVVISAI